MYKWIKTTKKESLKCINNGNKYDLNFVLKLMVQIRPSNKLAF